MILFPCGSKEGAKENKAKEEVKWKFMKSLVEKTKQLK